jgi:ATP-dependent DNA ligase
VSIHSQVAAFADKLVDQGCMGTFVFVTEVTHEDHTMPFKDVSGLCRAHHQCDELRLNVFDFYRPTPEGPDLMPFGKRIVLARSLVRGMFWCKLIPQILCRDAVLLAIALQTVKSARGAFLPEGAVIRNCNERWHSGKRSWGYQKVVDDPTTEVIITSLECAVSGETGEYIDMVGGMRGLYKGEVIGIGPGKLTHAERHALWTQYLEDDRRCLGDWRCTVKYKRDDSYKMLRQPTFQHWRPEDV